jgi:hypothetical protein
MQRLSIGRLPDCDIFINDANVSKMHAELIINNDNVTVRDLGSTNGTYVNGIRLQGSQILKKFDSLKVANSLVSWENYVLTNNAVPDIINIKPVEQTETVLSYQQPVPQNQSSNINEDKITCPKCGSAQIHIDTKGVSGLKACCGGAMCGPLGLLFGLSGAKKVRKTCLKCNNSWY